MTLLKFRAYHPKIGMSDPFTLDDLQEACLTTTYPREEYMVVQFTGLVDKHGKEIYEGDVIESEWHPGTLEVIEDIRDVGWYLSDGFLAGQENKGRLLCASVAGNIYENPDLFCNTTPDGNCVSDHPRCMHQAKEESPKLDWPGSLTKIPKCHRK